MKKQDDIITIKGIGKKTKMLFEKLGVETAEDLVTYYPRDYIKYPCVVEKIKDLEEEKMYLCFFI